MRVHLERVIIFNFKSFRGEVTIGPFKPFTSIIGANGSGKSNIMDAISFVMGEKSKSLRVRKLDDLIYGASVGKPITSSTYVTAIFVFEDDNKKTFTRTIHSNSCEYRINNKVVAVQSYISELGKLNLNVKAKNFLVHQGAVESIVTKTPKEYTSMFEEISNSIELKGDYERLKNELLKAEYDLQHIIKKKRDLVSKKKNALLEKEEADKYEMLYNQYLDIIIRRQLFELFHIQNDIEDLIDALNTVELKINEHEEDKEVAINLLRHKQQQLQMKFKYLESTEQDLTKMENAFKEKEVNFAEFKEKVSYWQHKLNSANALLAEAHKSNEVHVKTIKELQNELMQVEELRSMFEENMETQLLTQSSSVELNDAQVQEYFCLKQIAEPQSSENVQLCNSLKREQSINQNKLDNENRKKFELETKLNQKKILKDETNKQLINVQQYMKETTNALTDKTNVKCNLEEAINKRREEIQTAQLELQNVSEQLGNAKVDEYITLRLNKEAETIKVLQGLFPNVYGRLYNLCEPIHPRYEIAMTKVFGKYCNSIIVSTNSVAIQCIQYLHEQRIGVETFLPLESLKIKPTNTKLRSITNPKNVKLLYDVLQFSSEKINNAILFVTNNVLVCETPDDARMLAYEVNPHCKYNCVAIDGTYYKKEGIISGGQVELAQKAKVWQKHGLVELKTKKMKLIEELRKKTKISQSEFEMNTLDIQIYGLAKRLNYCKLSTVETEKKLAAIENEIKMIENELEIVHNNLTSIKETMEEKNHEIKNAERSIMDIEDNVFKDFCRDVGIRNIRRYEQGDLRVHQEQMKRKLELEEQYNRIKNQLDFEMSRYTENTVLKIEENIETAKQKLEKACQEEASNKIVIEEELKKLNNLRARYNEAEANVTEEETSTNECKRRIGVIARTIINAQKERSIIMANIERQRAKYRDIIKNSKIENVPIPLLSQSSEHLQHSSVLSDSNAEQRQSMDTHPRVDFSTLSENMKSREESNIDNLRSELTAKIEKLQNEMKTVENCNFKASEEVQSTIENLKELRAEHVKARETATAAKREFKEIKQKRYDQFTHSLDHISAQLNITYKCLIGDESVQAVLLPDDPEEPYLGGINFSCIAPAKQFQSISNLSGGEKTLAALALLFSIHSFRPAPFFVLDEVDAALDNANIKYLARFMRTKTEEMQFIVISLKEKLYAHADALVGVCTDLNGKHPESLIYTLSLQNYPSSREE